MQNKFTYHNITIVGTSHIAKESIANITAAFSANPAVVAVELDPSRLYALEHNIDAKPQLKQIRTLGVGGFLFALIGRKLQKKLGSIVGMQPGADMLAAVRLARLHYKELLLIDKPIEETLKAISRVPFREKARLAKDVVVGLLFKKGPVVHVNLAHVPNEDVIDTLLDVFKKKYPFLWKALVDDRNKHMVRKLHVFSHERPEASLLVVVGAGHAKAMIAELKLLDRRRDYVQRSH